MGLVFLTHGETCLETPILDWLHKTNTTMVDFGKSIHRAQSIVSRLARGLHRPDPSTALRIVVVTKGEITLDMLYGTPRRYRCDCSKKN